MADKESLPVSDDVQNANGQTEAELLDAVLRNSPISEELGLATESLPTEEIPEVDPVESDIEDPEESEEIVSEEEEGVEELEEEVEGEDAAEEAATEEPEIYSSEDLDLDAKVKVKVDGEELDVSFGDLLKGYQTDAHLSKKGRELGEAQKALDAEREAKLKEVTELSSAMAGMLSGQEQALAKEYNDLEAQIEKARKDGDTFEMNELKDKRELAQKNYWTARKQREGMQAAVKKQQEEVIQKQWQQEIEYFQKEIPTLIPDFNEKVADEIRKFALDEGISPEVLNQITDPKIVKFVDDYRRLKTGVTKGTAKRKAIPTKKALPTKKSPPAQKKAEDKAKMVKARAMKENATAEDHMNFLRQHASRSLNL